MDGSGYCKLSLIFFFSRYRSGGGALREEEKTRRQDRGGYFERDDGQKPSNHKDVATQSLGEFLSGATMSSDSEFLSDVR